MKDYPEYMTYGQACKALIEAQTPGDPNLAYAGFRKHLVSECSRLAVAGAFEEPVLGLSVVPDLAEEVA